MYPSTVLILFPLMLLLSSVVASSGKLCPERSDTSGTGWRCAAALSLRLSPFCFLETKRPLTTVVEVSGGAGSRALGRLEHCCYNSGVGTPAGSSTGSQLSCKEMQQHQNTVGGREETNHALITIKATLTHFQNNTSISPATLITQRIELNILNKPAHNCLFPHSALIKVTSHQSFSYSI